ncbi:DUF6979 family protein [Chlorobaculum limnaeum]|nr:transposase [Chlorobaculum limnaeum]
MTCKREFLKVDLPKWIEGTVSKYERGQEWNSAWFETYKELGGKSDESGKKGCPRAAAKTLYELGRIIGHGTARNLPLSQVVRKHSKNGAYAIAAIELLFGEIVDGEMVLNGAGELVDAEWKRIQKRYSNVILDTYQIMPNHLHGILQFTSPNSVGTGLVPVRNLLDEFVDNDHVDDGNANANMLENDIPASKRMGTRPIPTGLYNVIGTFKSLTQNDYAFHVRNNGWPPFMKRLWQLRFHDHIIRNDDELDSIRRYIIDNPINWLKDQNNPENMMKNNDLNG